MATDHEQTNATHTVCPHPRTIRQYITDTKGRRAAVGVEYINGNGMHRKMGWWNILTNPRTRASEKGEENKGVCWTEADLTVDTELYNRTDNDTENRVGSLLYQHPPQRVCVRVIVNFAWIWYVAIERISTITTSDGIGEKREASSQQLDSIAIMICHRGEARSVLFWLLRATPESEWKGMELRKKQGFIKLYIFGNNSNLNSDKQMTSNTSTLPPWWQRWRRQVCTDCDI